MREIIVKLAKHITDCMDIKLGQTKMDESRPEYWMLDAILTDEMAELMLKMKVRKPYTPAELAKKLKWDEAKVQSLLDELAQTGIVEYNWHNEDHHKQYVVPVFVVGSAENLMFNEKLKAEKTFLLNLMSSPGSGKTTTLERTIEALQGKFRIGVMEADIDSDVDAKTIARTGARTIQLHTGGMCHLDAGMTRQGLSELGTKDLDLVVLENVGNLVCPAEFDTGAAKNVMILSVPEGHDKPLKYPLMFSVCDALIINKMDVLPYFDFDMDKVCGFSRRRNPNIQIFPISAKTGEGVEEWCRWLSRQITDWKG